MNKKSIISEEKEFILDQKYNYFLSFLILNF